MIRSLGGEIIISSDDFTTTGGDIDIVANLDIVVMVVRELL